QDRKAAQRDEPSLVQKKGNDKNIEQDEPKIEAQNSEQGQQQSMLKSFSLLFQFQKEKIGACTSGGQQGRKRGFDRLPKTLGMNLVRAGAVIDHFHQANLCV